MMKKIKINNSSLLLSLILILLILTRLDNLRLPFYWDEAWSYATAVFNLADERGILPHFNNPDLTRGHPPVFYGLSAIWVKLTTTEPVTVHSFPLILSILLLIAVFALAKKIYGQATGLAAVILLSLQPVFIAQSTMLLPEVMMALWSVLTVQAYFQKKWFSFALFSILLVLTKETGLVLILVLLIDKIFLEPVFTNHPPGAVRSRAFETAIMGIPVAAFLLFIFLQKIRYGWFFYPEHINLMIVSPGEAFHRFTRITLKLFLHDGRWALFLAGTGSLVFLLRKKEIHKTSLRFPVLSLAFILLYLCFCSVNFFSSRYLLSVIPFLLITFSGITMQIVQNKNFLVKITMAILISLPLFYELLEGMNQEGDAVPGYKNTVLLQKKAVNYAEEMHWQNKTIYSAFLMQYYLSNPNLGYLSNKSLPFRDIGNKPGKKYDLYIFCSNENDPLYDQVKTNKNYLLIRKFESGKAWVAFYIAY
jgi:4-amino-4-deoxy-L-arabinose transferase-like glycosyltransferase